jgi:hypothetical protein
MVLEIDQAEDLLDALEADPLAAMLKIMGGAPTISCDSSHRYVKYPNGRELRQFSDGSVHYLLGGLLHREDGPAKVDADGSATWLFHGRKHREDGPAVEWADGSWEWWLNGKLHRKDGPASVDRQGWVWWLNGQVHREDGPAHEDFCGTKKWYLNGEELTEEEHARRTQRH